MTRTAAAAGPERSSRGAETRKRILDHAVDLASKDVLAGLTIGTLSEALGMSKAGLFAHFGSKEDLQVATIDAAREAFVSAVGAPAFAAAEGLPRLLTLLRGWMDYSEALSGGCFFSAASAELDDRPGPARDRLVEVMREWLAALEGSIDEARRLGHLRADVDVVQLAFELHSLELGANWARQLFHDGQANGRARAAQRRRLDEVATAAGKRLARAFDKVTLLHQRSAGPPHRSSWAASQDAALSSGRTKASPGPKTTASSPGTTARASHCTDR